MLENIATYVVLSAALISAGWLAGRLFGNGQFLRGGAGARPEIDAEYDFDRVWSQHLWRQRAALLRGHRHALDMPLVDGAVPLERLNRRDAGETVLALRHIVGSVDGANGHLDREFRPATLRARPRLEKVLAARRAGVQLPPIDVYEVGGDYYVIDGHHRVAAARALGEDYIAARVTELRP